MAAFVGAKASYTASSLDNYQRLMMAGPTALRDKMSDVGASVVVKKDTMRSSPTRRSKPGAEVARLDDTQDTDAASEAHQWSPNKPSRSGSYQPSAQQSFAGGATEAASADVQDAAGYSELQAAFERAYEKMLKDPPVSVVDSVLSSAWKPRSKRSAVVRTSFQKKEAKTTDWDTRAPVYEKKVFYDSITDRHCRRVVENPYFKQTLMRTRPAADHLLAHRVMDEEEAKQALRKGKKKGGRRSRRGRTERWQDTVRRFVKDSLPDEAAADTSSVAEDARKNGGSRVDKTRISAANADGGDEGGEGGVGDGKGGEGGQGGEGGEGGEGAGGGEDGVGAAREEVADEEGGGGQAQEVCVWLSLSLESMCTNAYRVAEGITRPLYSYVQMQCIRAAIFSHAQVHTGAYVFICTNAYRVAERTTGPLWHGQVATRKI